MGLFKCRSCAQWAQQYRSLQLDLADLRESLVKREVTWADERQRLLDRILAVEKPSIGVPIVKAHAGPMAVPINRKPGVPTLNIPGFAPDLRPPVTKKN